MDELDVRAAYAATSPPGPSTPWRDADFCVVDLETTGLDPGGHEIISFAAIRVAGGRVRLDDACYRLVEPRRMPGPDTVLIHGLRRLDLVGAPRLAEALDELLAALTGTAIVAHVAWIERAFLGAALEENGLRLVNPIIDTAQLAVELFRRRGQDLPERVGLTTLANTLGLPVHRPHEADGDALTTAQVFLALATHLDRFAPQTVGSLERLSRARPPRRRSFLRWLRRAP